MRVCAMPGCQTSAGCKCDQPVVQMPVTSPGRLLEPLRRMRRRFHTPEMGAVGCTRWFDKSEGLPALDWSRVTAVETSEVMTVEQFKTKFDVKLP